MMEKLLIAEDKTVRIDGQTGMPREIVSRTGELIVIKKGGGSYYSGQGQRRGYAPARFEIWRIVISTVVEKIEIVRANLVLHWPVKP